MKKITDVIDMTQEIFLIKKMKLLKNQRMKSETCAALKQTPVARTWDLKPGTSTEKPLKI